MSDTSHILNLPYIQPAQAQKHVTHNEAIRVLDTLVQLSVENRDQTEPPAAPSPGDRHIVASGASGLWAGQDNAIAVFEDAAWAFYPPQNGWQAVVRAEGAIALFNGLTWNAFSTGGSGSGTGTPSLDNIETLGVNTTADTTNRLAVSADATLLSHDGSDHRLSLNKAAETDTASLVFQTGYSGRAEMGTAGSDNFEIKTSADAATWNTALSLEATSGRVSFPSGAQIPSRLDVGGRIYAYTDNRWVTHSSNYGIQTDNISGNAGTGTDPSQSWTSNGALITQGTVLKSLEIALRASSSEVTGFDLRVYFQTGPWGPDWRNAASVTRTLIGSQDAAATGTYFGRSSVDLADYSAPADGFFLIYARPVGTITATRYLYSSMFLSYLTES